MSCTVKSYKMCDCFQTIWHPFKSSSIFFHSFVKFDRSYDRLIRAPPSRIEWNCFWFHRKPATLRLRVPRVVGMVARPSKASWGCRSRTWQGRCWGRRRRRWITAVWTAPRTPWSRLSRPWPACLLFSAIGPETSHSRHSTFLSLSFMAEPKSLWTPRLSGGLSRPGQRRRGIILV